MKRPHRQRFDEGQDRKRSFGGRDSSFKKRDEGTFGSRPPRFGRPDGRRFERNDRNDRNDSPRYFDDGAPAPKRFQDRDQPFAGRSSYRREGGMRGGYGQKPPAPNREGFASFTPAAKSQQEAPAAQPVAVGKLKDGIKQANKALAEVIEQFGEGIQGDYDISQLEAQVSFGADGRFLGFGQGGAVSFSLTITPLDADNLFAQDDDALLDDDADSQMQIDFSETQEVVASHTNDSASA